MAAVSTPSSSTYENVADVISARLQDSKFEDSDAFDSESPSRSTDVIEEEPTSCHVDDTHIYANLKEMEELNNRPQPPVPSPSDQPRRNLNNGWMEYETEAGRTYFYNSETKKSQWIPPRFIRTPAQVQAMLAATRDEMEGHCHQSTDESEVFDEVAEDEDSESEDPPMAPAPAPIIPTLPVKDRDPMLASFATNSSTTVEAVFSEAKPVTTSARFNSSQPTRSHSFKDRQLKNVPLPQVLPSTSTCTFQTQTIAERVALKSADDESEFRRSSGDCREPVRDVKWGTMEKLICDDGPKSRKREWQMNFLYLTSAHLIIYKDEKSAEKHGNHYAAPLGVCDLKGATTSWIIEKDRRKRKIIQLELTPGPGGENGPKYLLRSSSDDETIEWFEALRDVISRLPCPPQGAGLPRHASILDNTSAAVVRNPSHLSGRPHSTSLLTATGRGSTRRADTMVQSAIETTASHDEPRPSRETILERLRRFFRTRPSVESLREKGIYKCEAVFGSTLQTICQHEKSYTPKFLRTVMELIENKGMEVDGLYRVSGNLSAVQRIRLHVDEDKYGSLVNEEDVHVLTGALKLFFRELAEPLFPTNTHKDYLSAIRIPTAKQKSKRFDELLSSLPLENRETLKLLLRHLHRVAAHSNKNRMQAHNLAIMFGPTLFHTGEEKLKKKDVKKKKDTKKDDPPPIQSNSILASNMIMQGQIVEYLLNEHNRFEALQGPLLTHRPS